MHIDAFTIRELARLLIDCKLLCGGEQDYRIWVIEILNLCFSHREKDEYGGLIVPQLGKGAGIVSPLSIFPPQSTPPQYSKIQNYILSSWDNNSFRTKPQQLLIPTTNIKIVSVPISYDNDEPIGLLWVKLGKDRNKEIEAILNFIANLVVMRVYETKGLQALDYLASDSWYEDSKDEIIKKVANLCAAAISCKQVVVWEADPKKKALITKAVTGKARGIGLDLDLEEGLAGKCYTNEKPKIYRDLSKEDVAHEKIVEKYGLKSAIMVPLDAGDYTAGVIGVYAGRIGAFNNLDLVITKAFAQRLCAGYIFAKQFEELKEIKDRAFIEAPAIEAGLAAMELVHDINDYIGFAQGQLGDICSYHKKQQKSIAYRSAFQASKYLDNASDHLKLLTRRSKVNQIIRSKNDLVELLNEVKTDSAKDINEARIDLQISLPEKKVFSKVDKIQLKRVFVNMIKNSIYFLKTVRRGNKYINIQLSTSDTIATIKIEDNGPGIYSEDIPKVFNLFFTKKGEKGMGLGLALGERIIKEHDGKISVSSRWGSLTEFKIELPLL